MSARVPVRRGLHSVQGGDPALDISSWRAQIWCSDGSRVQGRIVELTRTQDSAADGRCTGSTGTTAQMISGQARPRLDWRDLVAGALNRNVGNKAGAPSERSRCARLDVLAGQRARTG